MLLLFPQADERLELRELGRKKLEEFRKLKSMLLSGRLSRALLSNVDNTSMLDDVMQASPATTPASDCTKHPVEDVASTKQDAVGGPAVADPLVDMLLQQLHDVMHDKQALQQECGELRSQNEQLSELVGYLSHQLQEQSSTAAALPSDTSALLLDDTSATADSITEDSCEGYEEVAAWKYRNDA